MRINASRFDPETERELTATDVVDDLLIRCPFDVTFVAWQVAQLRARSSSYSAERIS